MFRSAFSCRVCYTGYYRNNLAKDERIGNRSIDDQCGQSVSGYCCLREKISITLYGG